MGRTIESVLSQDFRDFEIVVVDDGSTDGSADIARGYSDRVGERFKFVTQDRAGAGAARNRGIHLASGELVAFLDADDIWIPEKLGRQVRFMEDHPDVAWCSTNYWVGNDDGSELPSAVPFTEASSKETWTVVDWFWAMATGHIAFQTSGVLLRRSVIDRAGVFDATIPSGQDFDYWVRIAEITPQCGYFMAPCYTFSRDSLYSITFNEERKYAGKVGMLARMMERSTRPTSPQAYQDLIRFVSIRIIRGSIAEGQPLVARSILRSFPKHWRTPRHRGYLLLTYLPVPILRLLRRFVGRIASRLSGRPVASI